MSSEALERAQDVDLIRAALGGDNVAALEALDALLAEVARLEQEPVELRRAWRANVEELTKQYGAALAVAREREQRLREAFLDLERNTQRHMEDCCRTDIEWREQMATHDAASCALGRARAALVDEPAAAESAVVWSEPRQDYTGRFYRDGLGTGTPAAATLAEPEPQPTEARDKRTAESRPTTLGAPVSAPSGSASAAADEPGETPA